LYLLGVGAAAPEKGPAEVAEISAGQFADRARGWLVCFRALGSTAGGTRTRMPRRSLIELYRRDVFGTLRPPSAATQVGYGPTVQGMRRW
jgi:hypothetical protein